MTPPDPGHVLLVGDVHGNLKWMLHVLDEADKLFTAVGESRRIVIQLGDFGWRPTPGNDELLTMNMLLGQYDMELWFIDGNHDWHPDLARLRERSGTVTLPGCRNIRYLPRGTRWTWAGRTWLAVGGAASVDRLTRTEGADWWPEEEITPAQADAVIAAGPADVLLAHDCPDCWIPFDRLMPLDDVRRIFPYWIPELPRARAHSRLLERIARETGVTRVFHGHYHLAQDVLSKNGLVGEPDVRVTGLDMDGTPGNCQLADVEAICGSASHE